MTKPTFSIITVTKNCEKTILSTLNSIKFQSFRNYEHIVLDGYSSDDTYEIISKFKSDHIKKKQIHDKSCYDAINHAFTMVNGQYVLLLHSGDILFSLDTLKHINNHLDIKYDILIGGCIFYNSDYKVKRVWQISDNKKISIVNCYCVPHTATIISKKLIDEIGIFNLKYKISSDIDYILRIFSKKNVQYKILDYFVCFMKIGGLSTDFKNIIKKTKEDLIVYKSYFGIFNFFFIYIVKISSKLSQFFRKNEDFNLNLKSIIKKISTKI